MFKNIGEAIWRAAKSPAGQHVLTLGAAWLIARITKGSPKAQKVVAITAREYGRLEALAETTGTEVDDMALAVLKEGVTRSEARLVESTVKLLREAARPKGD